MTVDLLIGSHPSIDTYPYAAISGFQEDHSSSYKITKTCAFKSFFEFFVNFPKRVSLWGDLSRVLPEMDKGIDFLRIDLKSELIQYAYIYQSIYKHKPYMVLPIKACNHHFWSKHHTDSLILKPFIIA